MDFEVASPDAFEISGKTQEKTTAIHAGKHDIAAGTSLYDLATGLQYGLGTGSKQLVKFLTEHIKVSPCLTPFRAALTKAAHPQPALPKLANHTQRRQHIRF